MNGTDLSDEHVKAFLKLTVDDGVMGAEGSPALYLAIVTAALWTIHALLICPADEHVAWHDVADHASVYQALALKVKAQTKVMADVLDDSAFDCAVGKPQGVPEAPTGQLPVPGDSQR